MCLSLSLTHNRYLIPSPPPRPISRPPIYLPSQKYINILFSCLSVCVYHCVSQIPFYAIWSVCMQKLTLCKTEFQCLINKLYSFTQLGWRRLSVVRPSTPRRTSSPSTTSTIPTPGSSSSTCSPRRSRPQSRSGQ